MARRVATALGSEPTPRARRRQGVSRADGRRRSGSEAAAGRARRARRVRAVLEEAELAWIAAAGEDDARVAARRLALVRRNL
jgi:hypothetical protein